MLDWVLNTPLSLSITFKNLKIVFVISTEIQAIGELSSLHLNAKMYSV